LKKAVRHAGALHDWAQQIGMNKVAAIITDNAANMVKARQLAVKMEGMGHIIPLR
jgi:HD superfamily phosphohydrolase YqeK